MAYKKDIRPWLKENGYTWEDMNKFWKECCEINLICKMIADSGKSWSDMTMHQIKLLPTLKETTLAQLKAKEEEEKRQAEEKKRKQEEAEYYVNHFDEIMVKKIDNGESLSENELSEICEYSIQRDYGENRRWQRSVYDILEIKGRYFALEWEEGLTEYQEDSFMKQPYEVFPHKTVTIKESVSYSKEKKEDVKEYIIKDKSNLEKLDELIPIIVTSLVATKNVKVILSEDTLVIKAIK